MLDSPAAVTAMPCSRESEMMVLGCMVSNTEHLVYCCDRLEPSDFYFSEHELIFKCMHEMYMKEISVDCFTFSEFLKDKDALKKVGGIPYIVSLSQFAGVSALIEEYCDIVKAKSLLRKMIYVNRQIQTKAMANPSDPEVLLEENQRMLYDISRDANDQDPALVAQIIAGEFDEDKKPLAQQILELKLRNDQGELVLAGMPTGFLNLDEYLGGLVGGHLLVLGARPGVGKTTFSLNICLHVAKVLKQPCAFFSLEMQKTEVTSKLVSMHANIPYDRVRRGQISGQEYQRLVKAMEEVAQMPIYIDDQPGMRIGQLRTRARRLRDLHDIKFIVIDYLQLISTGVNADNRNNQIAMLSITLKCLAKELNIPVMCLSQLNRKCEESNRAPIKSDLRESGQIEQDADEILFLHKKPSHQEQSSCDVDVIIAKNRFGREGVVSMRFDCDTGNFYPQPRIAEAIAEINKKTCLHSF